MVTIFETYRKQPWWRRGRKEGVWSSAGYLEGRPQNKTLGMGSEEGLAVSLERLHWCIPVFAQGRCSLSEKQKCFPRIEGAHLFHGRCARWAVVISCQCRQEGEICVSRLQLAGASTKFLVIFRKLNLSLEVLGMYHFLLSAAFQPFSFVPCYAECREMWRREGRIANSEGWMFSVPCSSESHHWWCQSGAALACVVQRESLVLQVWLVLIL